MKYLSKVKKSGQDGNKKSAIVYWFSEFTMFKFYRHLLRLVWGFNRGVVRAPARLTSYPVQVTT